MLEQLTPKQADLIPHYKVKWRTIALSTERIDREQATVAVKAAYALLEEAEPAVLFFDSPQAALTAAYGQLWEQLKPQLESDEWTDLLRYLEDSLFGEVLDGLFPFKGNPDQLHNELFHVFWEQLHYELDTTVGLIQQQLGYRYQECNTIQDWACFASLFDFGISVLDINVDQPMWSAFLALTAQMYWIFPLRGICLVSDRPTRLTLDAEGKPHSEGDSPAIEFADGIKIYAQHGMWVKPDSKAES